MRDVELLEPGLSQVAEARQICTRSLELRERFRVRAVGKVFIKTKLLLTGEVVIETHRELVLRNCRIGDGLEHIRPDVRVRHKAAQQIGCRGIEAGLGNDVAREDRGVGSTGRYGNSAIGGHG